MSIGRYADSSTTPIEFGPTRNAFVFQRRRVMQPISRLTRNRVTTGYTESPDT